MYNYIYKCFSCNKTFEAEFIENNFHYLCPECGKAERNKPLEGVLLVEYEYDRLKKKLKRDKFLNLPAGKFWLYPELWPVSIEKINDDILNKIALPSNQLLKYEFDGRKLLLMDETRNPTLSYKDRASSLVALKALEAGVAEISAASTGNAGSSIAGICARLGINSHIFVPSTIPEAKRIQIQSFGANIYLVEGSYDDAFDLCLEVSEIKKWYNRNTAYNPLTVEGKKSAAYDIFIQSEGNIPNVIFVPVGDGVIISAIYKGFTELLKLGWIEKLPELIAVQAEGSNVLERFLTKNIFEFRPAKTIADSISAGAPRNLYLAAEAVKSTEGMAVSVTDGEILSAQKSLAVNFGIIAEPSSAATLAGYKKLRDTKRIHAHDNILLLITGNGLKDSNALEEWNKPLKALTISGWREFFKSK